MFVLTLIDMQNVHFLLYEQRNILILTLTFGNGLLLPIKFCTLPSIREKNHFDHFQIDIKYFSCQSFWITEIRSWRYLGEY